MDEIKDKIIIAVKSAIANNAEAVDCDYNIIEIDCNDVDHIAEQVADALIEAGIGDVKSLVDGNCVLYVKDKGFMRLYPEGVIKKLEHRAKVEEQAFHNMMKAFHELLSVMFPDKKIDFDEWMKDILANAEKELAEEG